jgi:hypothetical protein
VVVQAADINKDLLSSMVAMEASLLMASSLNMDNNMGTVNNKALAVDIPSRATDLLVVDMGKLIFNFKSAIHCASSEKLENCRESLALYQRLRQFRIALGSSTFLLIYRTNSLNRAGYGGGGGYQQTPQKSGGMGAAGGAALGLGGGLIGGMLLENAIDGGDGGDGGGGDDGGDGGGDF